jgi:hypothetical protein
MVGDAMTVTQVELEHATRERAYLRAQRDPEGAWLSAAARPTAAISIDLRAAGRALQTIVLTVLGRA